MVHTVLEAGRAPCWADFYKHCHFTFSCYFLMLLVTIKVRPVERKRAGEGQICSQHNMLVLLPQPLIPKSCFFRELFLLKLFLAFDTESFILGSHFLLQITWQTGVKKWCACVIKKQPSAGEQPHTIHTSSSGQTFYVDRLIPPAMSDMGGQNNLFRTFLLTIWTWRCWNKIFPRFPALTMVWENFC